VIVVAEIVLEIPGLQAEPSPNGGIRFRCIGRDRSVFGVMRRIPGRLVYVRDVAGERRSVGWTAIDGERDVIQRALDLMIWVATGKYPERDE
jgi:hypothetical protein